ncbi:hypothetical protein ACU8V1_23510 [Rhizobium leguminosarum]
MVRIWRWLGRNKDNLTVVFTLVGALVFLYEYNAKQYENRIQRAFETADILSRDEVISAKIYLDLKWFDQTNAAFFLKHPTLDNELLSYITTEALKDDKYMASFLRLHLQYRQYIWCPQMGLCDWQTSCRLERSDIAPFLSRHQSLYSTWAKINNEASYDNAFKLFTKTCGATNVISAGYDKSIWCSASIAWRGYFNMKPGNACAIEK